MLITDYLVGRDEKDQCFALVVREVLPTDCRAGRCHLVQRVTRQDLVQEFVQDGMAVDWIMFPDLPADVVNLLRNGGPLRIIDQADDTSIECRVTLEASTERQEVSCQTPY